MPPSTGKTDFFLGTWNAQTDTFTSLLDLNDQTTFYIQHGGLETPVPEKTVILAGNIRSNGSIATRTVYKERHITVKVSVRGASADAIISSVHTLLGILETNQFCIKYSWPGESNYSYADVVAVNKSDVPYDPMTILAKASMGIMVDFLCATGLRGDRQILQNLVFNPGFSAPSGAGVTVFSDTFANANAYSSQAGSAPSTPVVTTTFSDIAMTVAVTPTRYYEFGEPSGTTAYDSSGNAQNGTYNAGVTLGTSSLAAGNNGDKAITLNGTTGDVSLPTSGLPTGNTSWSVACLCQIAGAPAGNASLWSMGSTSGTRTGVWCQITSGKVVTVGVSGGSGPASAVVLTTGAPHLIVLTWDGTTLKLYVDNNAAVTSTPGALALTYTSGGFMWGANFNTGTPSQFYGGILDEGIIWTSTALSGANVTSLYNAGISNSGYVTINNVLSLASGARAAFGSPSWNAYNTWQMRLRWVSGLTFNAYLHYTDANNYLRVQMTFNTLKFTQTIAGVATDLASITITQALSPNFWYWLKITQFPQPAISGSNVAPGVLATVYSDSSGSIGSQYSNATTGTVPTQDAATALLGRPQIEASGATALFGGNQTNQFMVNLFGPGGWLFTGTNGGSTGTCSGGWELDTTKTYPGGPITSVGAARIDMAPAGTMGCYWQNYSGGAAAGTYAMPVATSGDVIYASIWAKTNSVGVASTLKLNLLEYNASGTLLTTTTLQTVTGGTTASGWQQLSGHVTTGSGGTTAYCGLQALFTDTNANASANGILWLDNAQCWDATTTGTTSMSYHELRMPQSPGQFLVSGLLGDIKAPALVSIGSFFTSWAPSGPALTYVLGRRAQSSANPQMVSAPYGALATNMSKIPILDSTRYGGYYWTITGTFSATFWLNLTGTSFHSSDMYGQYHMMALAQTSESTNIANVVTRVGMFQQNEQWWLDGNGKILATTHGGQLAPFTAQNTWTLVDAGFAQVPPFPSGALADPTKSYIQYIAELYDTNGTNGKILQTSWNALIPVDGEVLLATAYNQANSYTVTNQYHWIYADGILVNRGGANDSDAWLFSDETASLAAPGNGIGGTGTATNSIGALISTGSPNINSAGDPFLYLDPTIDSGANANQIGVNEFAGVITDATGATYQMLLEFQYSPLYLSSR